MKVFIRMGKSVLVRREKRPGERRKKGGRNLLHAFQAMNTTMHTVGLPLPARQQVESWFLYVEGKLSRFLPSSELSQLNRSNGRLFLASALLYELVSLANFYFEKTGGLFHPFLGKVMEKIGYDRSFETLNDPHPFSPGWELEFPDPSGRGPFITLEPSTRSVILSPHVSLDLGGIAKGWSAQKMSDWLRKDGVASGWIDAGGDLVAWGIIGQEESRECMIADPFQPEQDRVRLVLSRDAGIATSSICKRRWKDRQHQVQHHIIDPRIGRPSNSDLVQVTVLAPDLTTAEVYAKCLLILGSETGEAWLEEKQMPLGYVGIRNDRSVILGTHLHHYCSEWSVLE
jgi:thiamine biosynthesis lipoprotein